MLGLSRLNLSLLSQASRNPFAAYAVNGVEPALVADFSEGTYLLAPDESDFDTIFGESRTGSGDYAVTSASPLTIAAAVMPYDAAGMTWQMEGAETFTDEGSATQEALFTWGDTTDGVFLHLDTDGAKTGSLTATVYVGGASASVTEAAMSPGTDQPFNVAWTVGPDFIEISVSGGIVERTDHALGVPDVSADDCALSGNGNREIFRAW